MFVGKLSSFSALWCSLQKTLLNEKGFVHFFDSAGFFANGHSYSIEANGPTGKLTDNSVKDTLVHFIETELINVEGAIQVNQVQGNIILRSNHPLRDPVLLLTGRGDINAAIVPASVGKLDLSSATGRVTYRALEGVTRRMNAGQKSFRGELNEASNTIKMQADGNVTLIVRPNAGAVINPQ